MSEKTIRLLLAAGLLMLISGGICCFLGRWIYAALVWIGAFGCFVSAVNFKNQSKGE